MTYYLKVSALRANCSTDTFSESVLYLLLQDFKQQKHLEFLWYPPYLDNAQPIFAHVLDSHYTTPLMFGLTIKVPIATIVFERTSEC